MAFPTLKFACVALFGASLLMVSCSDDVDQTPSGPVQCEPGSVYNPITGVCSPTGNNNPDPPNNTSSNNVVSTNNMSGNNSNNVSNNQTNNQTNTNNTMGSDRCLPGLDSDGDGLENECECFLGTNPYLADTDGDGLEDGEEDANGSCDFDPGETDPRSADTDSDGLNDGDERAAGTDPLNPDSEGDGIPDGVEVASGCMNPLETDTDGDGLPDDLEDSNGDGELGTCVNRMFDPQCAGGESDPCVEDTDGDGTPDSGEAQYRQCLPEDTQNLIVAQKVDNINADYQLVHDASATVFPVSTTTSAPVEAHVFEDATARYTGFVLSFDPSGETNPVLLGDALVGSVQAEYPSAARRVSGRRVVTHDGFEAAVASIVDLPAGTSLSAARDALLAEIAGVMPSEISHGATAAIAGDTSPTVFVHQVVSRSASQAIVVGALVTLDDYQNTAIRTGYLVDDLTGGNSLAGQMDQAVEECVAYTVTAKPKVDIIISIDGSGSMNDEQNRLASFVTTFTTLLTNSNLDWRAAVTRPDCNDNMGLSQDMTDLISAHCQAIPIPIGFPFPGFGGKTGELVAGGFTAVPSELQNRLDPSTFESGGEYTISALTAAADRALPRSDTDATKFRTEAAVVLIAISDEEDEFFQDALSFGNSQSITLDATQEAELETETQPWIDFLLRPEIGATSFGIVWPPGEACPSGNGAAVAHAVAAIANGTGGSVGSICQADIASTLQEIANATAGIASGLRLRGAPLPPTLKVVHGEAVSGNISDMPRSRADGFDYDAIVNRVKFTGTTPPQTGDRVVIPYRRWENSVFVCQTNADCPSEQKLECLNGECR